MLKSSGLGEWGDSVFSRLLFRADMTKLSSFLILSSLVCLQCSVVPRRQRSAAAPYTTVTNDFESGITYPWFDSSPSDVHWMVEDVASLVESSPAPQPASGTKYLRAYRGDSGTAFGLAIFSSPYFTAVPGDNISLNFWIRSQHTGGNSLEVYYVVDGIETRILNLGIFSSPSNYEWRSASSRIPVSSPTEIRLVIYGYCGGNADDAIAIDNIVVKRPEDNSTTTVPLTTTTTIATTVSEGTTRNTDAVTTNEPTIETTTTTTVLPSCWNELDEATGLITSANYPENYEANTTCFWIIRLRGPYTKIKFDFVDFQTETCCDSLTIFDGPTETSAVLLKHQGTFLPTPASVTSTTSEVLLKFQSDFGIQNKGFYLEYSGVY